MHRTQTSVNADIRMEPSRVLQGSESPWKSHSARVMLSRPRQSGRRAAEVLIEDVYARTYGGRIDRHYPLLLNVRDEHDQVVAAVGLRFADDGPLFLESYLDSSIETMIARMTGRTVARRGIVEIGNLAATGRGASFVLFMALASFLKQQGLSYAAVTATKALRRSLVRLGVDFVEATQASPSALPDNGAAWGTYYSREPKILFGAIEPVFGHLQTCLQSGADPLLRRFLSLSLNNHQERM